MVTIPLTNHMHFEIYYAPSLALLLGRSRCIFLYKTVIPSPPLQSTSGTETRWWGSGIIKKGLCSLKKSSQWRTPLVEHRSSARREIFDNQGCCLQSQLVITRKEVNAKRGIRFDFIGGGWRCRPTNYLALFGTGLKIRCRCKKDVGLQTQSENFVSTVISKGYVTILAFLGWGFSQRKNWTWHGSFHSLPNDSKNE